MTFSLGAFNLDAVPRIASIVFNDHGMAIILSEARSGACVVHVLGSLRLMLLLWSLLSERLNLFVTCSLPRGLFV